jgi:wyosine [tRNA(Phe)-imidazoG37] synthetase (radical SAM superfamily)
MPLPLIDQIIYGPVQSRRLGRSLGVNVLPPGLKVCNMNCAYCQYGWTRGPLRSRGQGTGWPSAQAVEAAIETRLACAAGENERIDRITIAGHGEPTLHPTFDEVVNRICKARDRLAPLVRVAVLSNSTMAGAPDVKKGLARLDERYMKLDAGDPFTSAEINGSTMSLMAVADALRALPPVVIQAMFVADTAGRVDNTSDIAVNLWLAMIETVRPQRVHIYTIDRAPALGTLRPVRRRRLREIAERVHHAGIPADVFATHDCGDSERLRAS